MTNYRYSDTRPEADNYFPDHFKHKVVHRVLNSHRSSRPRHESDLVTTAYLLQDNYTLEGVDFVGLKIVLYLDTCELILVLKKTEFHSAYYSLNQKNLTWSLHSIFRDGVLV